MNTIFKKLGFLCLIITAFLSINCTFAKDISKSKTPSDILSTIDNYQAQYFEITKRNDYFLTIESNSETDKDKKELKKLYRKVTKKITNKKYLKEYKTIEKRYAKCDEITTPGINKCAENNYNEVDALLNKVYKNVKSKISSEDFKKLSSNEKEWLKEVDDYKKTFDSMEFGTIGTLVYYTYQTDMKQFRALLLMFYL